MGHTYQALDLLELAHVRVRERVDEAAREALVRQATREQRAFSLGASDLLRTARLRAADALRFLAVRLDPTLAACLEACSSGTETCLAVVKAR